MDFAIVGMQCVLPGSPSVEHWLRATDPAFREVPQSRWPAGARQGRGADHAVSTIGGWVDDRGGLIAWTQEVVGSVLDESGADPDHTQLVLANLSLPSDVAVDALEQGRTFHHSSEPATHCRRFFRLDRVTSLDGACASGLYAVRMAMHALAKGSCRVAVAAGVQSCAPSYLLVGFSQLQALSPTGTPLPFDQSANGLVVGEGAAAVALMRLDDALRQGRRIHAVLESGGLGNDGRSGNLLAPSSQGQLRAMQSAWKGLDPRSLGYVECHATGTPLGDRTEVDSLQALLQAAGPSEHPVAIGSAKALIGHTITVAGLAGLLRAVGAVRDGFVPAGAANPIEAITTSEHLRAAPQRETWPKGRPRRAAVSAFGFGGTNAHLIISAPPEPPKPAAAPPPAPERQGRFGIRAGLRRLLDRSPEAPAEPLQVPQVPRQELVETPRLSIVGVAAQIGTRRNETLYAALRRGRPVVDAAGRAPLGGFALDPRRWRIPPLALQGMLRQQLLALELAGDALESAGIEGPDVGVVFAMELDPTPCRQVQKWRGTARVPDLSAQRVQGQLPNFVANRISAQLDLTGPSYTVSAGGAGIAVAIEHAAAMLTDPSLQTVLVGAVDAAGEVQGGVVFALQRAQDGALAELDLVQGGAPRAVGHAPLDGARVLLQALFEEPSHTELSAEAGDFSFRLTPRHSVHTEVAERRRTLDVAEEALPHPSRFGPGDPSVVVPGPAEPAMGALRWDPFGAARGNGTRSPERDAARREPRAASREPRAASVRPEVQVLGPRGAAATEGVPDHSAGPNKPSGASFEVPRGVLEELAELQKLSVAMARSQETMLTAHRSFLTSQQQATRALARLGTALGTAVDTPSSVPTGLLQGRAASFPPPSPRAPVLPAPALAPSSPAPRVRETRSPAPPAHRAPTGEAPREYDRAALEVHASGTLSQVFGPTFAHLDRYEPRTRMPQAPLLLCSRVLDIEGTPLQLGPSRIVTEYDLPTDASWSHHDGKPNACVIVESGQADLFLVSWLGIEADCLGERVYRLLDCDLIFHGPRPCVGETLHHDIRIKRFARVGSKILFYFEYDCTSNTDGRAVLSMRNGCAGFFTPAELATPHGVDPSPRPVDAAPRPIQTRRLQRHALDRDGVQHLVHGRFSAAFGPAFADADGSRLTLPDSEWRLVHEVEDVRTHGGPHGLGLARTLQILRDDDWFNPCHFQGDPCMPGTLMLEGCLQAVQTWLLATGIAAAYPDGFFEPMPERAFELRCRGQVVPGHSRLTYEAQIREADLGPNPYAIADVLLCVDGTPVVWARDIGVTLGRRSDAPTQGASTAEIGSSAGKAPIQRARIASRAASEPVVDVRRIYEYSIGDAEKAFGPRYHDYAGLDPRCARMPGPPLLQMTEVRQAERPFEVRQGSEVTIDYRVPPQAWYFETTPGTSMPFAILLETALQPCGWLTAWEAAGIKDGRDLFFRNLGGTATQHAEVWPDAGTLTTRTRQTTVAESAGLLIHRFELEVTHGDQPVYSCTTSFGYFTAAALNGQRGLPLRDEDRRAEATGRAEVVDLPLPGHPSMPRDDWRNVDRVVRVDSTGGRQGLGWYVAEKDIDPTEWFFTAHFFLDPVMPGSLGLEAALQLARWVFEERTGRKARVTPIRVGVPHSWKYRGQMRRPVKKMAIELEVTALSDDEIVFDAVLRADGLPIYELNDFGMTAVAPRAAVPEAPLPPRGPHAAALLDRFEVDTDTGTGVLRLDPARFPWLRDHCPTLTAPAVPLAFAAEIAAEAAQLLRPGHQVVGVPLLEAESWIHTGDGPVDLWIAAVADGDEVAVSLALHVENVRFPKLSGPKAHMKAIVQTGESWYPAPPVPAELDAPATGLSVADYYGGGLTFHGPTLQGMVDTGVRDASGAEATFGTKPDAELNGAGQPFLLDPLLLDTATHPMVSGEPELWVDGLGPGFLAYPVRCEDLRLHGPRPRGQVRCRLTTVAADRRSLVFDVLLIGAHGPWCSFRWTEAIVPGGPVLGQSTPVRKAFIWDRQPRLEVQIGRPTGERFRVEAADLVEPIEGTLVGLCCTERELEGYRAASDRRSWALARLAAKGAARHQLQQRCRDVHPRDIELLDLRPDRFITINSPTLTAQELIDHLGPTRWHLHVATGPDWAEAWLEPTEWPT